MVGGRDCGLREAVRSKEHKPLWPIRLSDPTFLPLGWSLLCVVCVCVCLCVCVCVTVPPTPPLLLGVLQRLNCTAIRILTFTIMGGPPGDF